MLEELNSDPGELTSPPNPPKEGIPKQWLPRPMQRMIQLLCLPYVLLDMGAQKIAKKIIPPPYIRVGQCKKRGNCCYYLRLRKVRYIDWLQKFWVTQINGFFFRSAKTIKIEKHQYYIMGCRHLKSNGECENYFLRPLICRTWPVIEKFGYPQLLKGCGFEAKLKTKYKQNESLKIIK